MEQYAINGYEVDAFDYILKPLSYPRFEIRMNKAVKEVEKKKAHSYVYSFHDRAEALRGQTELVPRLPAGKYPSGTLYPGQFLAVNGLGGEDVKFEVGTPIYRIALWALWGLLAAYFIYSIIRMIQYGRMNDEEFADSRNRTAKSRRIKSITLAVVLLGLAAYLLITYLPVLQKAFMI